MGRPSSPHQQGREQDRMFVGVDVSKDRLDVHIRPSGTVFSVSRDEAGLSELVKQLAAIRLTLIVLEATGGFETIVATTLAAALPLAVVNPRQIRAFAGGRSSVRAALYMAELVAMLDGSDAVSDWPILNALLNCASDATWVSLHHGGGVGIGYSQHAGMVIVCDGTEAAARRIERVLWNDPASGVMRHADAGYDMAVDCAREHGLDLPSLRA